MEQSLSYEEVLETAERVKEQLVKLVAEAVIRFYFLILGYFSIG
ncbi:hypothetical protein [Xenorhabdus miraniensis]|nr:hypothetical protein [Xenorhabdus miraniensis]